MVRFHDTRYIARLEEDCTCNFPAVPSLPLDFPIAKFFTEKPLSALGWWPTVHLFIYPSIIAIVYLLTLEISFSFWFFFMLGKMETVLIYATGSKVNQWNFHQNQQMGALLVFIGFILFIGKRHFGRAFATIFGKRTSDDSNEPLPYVWAVGGLIVGILLLTLICSMAGMSVWVALVMLGIFLGITTVGTWMVANGGLLFIIYSFLPGEFLITLFGEFPCERFELDFSRIRTGLDVRYAGDPHAGGDE